MTVRVTDRGANELLRRLREAQRGTSVKVGVIGAEAADTTPDGTLTVADVASFHEFGLGNNEKRSFIRAYVDERDAELRQRLRGIGEAVIRRRLPVAPGLDQFGSLAIGEIKERMAAGLQPNLSDAYVARRKLTDNTARLIRTEQLRSSITYAVEPGMKEGT